jgi:hypothetical protein
MPTRVLIFCSAACILEPIEVQLLRERFGADCRLQGTQPQGRERHLLNCREHKQLSVYIPTNTARFLQMYQSVLTPEALKYPHYLTRGRPLSLKLVRLRPDWELSL